LLPQRYKTILDLPLTVLQTPIIWEAVDVTPILKDGRTAIPDDAIASGIFTPLS